MAEAAILTAYHNSLQTGRGPPTGRQFIGQRTPWRDPSPFESHPKGRWQLQVAARQSESTLRDNEKKSVETSKEKKRWSPITTEAHPRSEEKHTNSVPNTQM